MTTLVLSNLNLSSLFLHIRRTTIKASMSLNFVKVPSPIMELAALEHLKNLMDNVVTTLAPSFLSGSSSFLQVTRSTMKAWMCSKFGQIRHWTVGLAALKCLTKIPHRLIMGEML